MKRKTTYSRRAWIFRKILPFINSGDWEEIDDYIVFGKDAYDRALYGEVRSSDDEVLDEVRKLLEHMQRASGQKLANKRISLDAVEFDTPDLDKFVQALPASSIDKIIQILQEVQAVQEVKADFESPEVKRFVTDADRLDLKFAEEIVGKLGKIVDRATRLSEPELLRIPNKSVRCTFIEAHKCYLYGFDQSCAVLCRSIIESALIEILDPDGLLRPKSAKESYISNMVNSLGGRTKLKENRPKMVIDIRDAGNDAVHSAQVFSEKWPFNKVEDNLLGTRMILEALYG